MKSLLLCLLICSFLLAACGGGGGGGGTPGPTPVTKATWTFMVYLDADNDLDPYASGDLAEMMAVGSTAEINIIVQYDGYSTPSITKTAYRYKVEKGTLTKLADLGEVNMASAQTISEFISYAASNYPAERYALVLWNHGNGWKSGSSAKQVSSILADWDNNGAKSAPLDNNLVAKGIAGGGVTIDMLGVDACIMATIESTYEFRNVARYIVASQELVQIKGWDYRDILTRLTSSPSMSASDLAIQAVASYKAQSDASGLKDQTISAISMSEIQSVATAVDAMSKSWKMAIPTPGSLSKLTTARALVQEFDPYVDANTYIDLTHFATLLDGSASPVASAVKKAVIAEYHGPDRANSNGLSIAFFNLQKIYNSSIFLKMSLYDPAYINLATTRTNPVGFLDNTAWGTLLDSYFTLQYPAIYPAMRSWKYMGAL